MINQYSILPIFEKQYGLLHDAPVILYTKTKVTGDLHVQKYQFTTPIEVKDIILNSNYSHLVFKIEVGEIDIIKREHKTDSNSVDWSITKCFFEKFKSLFYSYLGNPRIRIEVLNIDTTPYTFYIGQLY